MKLQILVNDKIVDRIDRLAAYVGQSRSSICASILAKALPEWESIMKPGEVEGDICDVPGYEQMMIEIFGECSDE